MKLREAVDGPGLDYLLSHVSVCMVREEQVKFKRYAFDLLENGNQRIVTYTHSNPQGKGRVYADGALSLQGFSKGIRKHLAGNLYHDIDIVNCHPTILLHICTLHQWPVPLLTQYVTRREETLKAWKTTKVNVLSIMYGGGTGLASFRAEMTRIAKLVFEKYPDMPISSPKNPLFSRLSMLLQDVEHQLLMEMSNFFKHQGFEIGVYMFDGLMLYRKPGMYELPLQACEEILSVKVKLVEKK